MAGSSSDIRRHIAGQLDGTITLDDFQDWFASAAMAIELHGSDAEVDLSNHVMGILAEYTSDHISADEVMRALCDASDIRTPTISVSSVA